MRTLSTFLLIAVLWSACTEKPNTQSTVVNEPPVWPESLQKSLDAHGGMDQWKSYAGLTFKRVSGKRGETEKIDLHNRREYWTNDSTFTAGFDGTEAWVMPDSAAFPNFRFYHNLYFYFFAFPFVAADPGINYEDLGVKDFMGKKYNVVSISYGSGVGDSPDDKYIIYMDAETNLVHMLNYSVTYFDKSRGNKMSALIFDGWQSVDGIQVPTTMTGYKWDGENLGKKRYFTAFENISFSKTAYPDSLFEKPAGAYISKMPQQ